MKTSTTTSQIKTGQVASDLGAKRGAYPAVGNRGHSWIRSATITGNGSRLDDSGLLVAHSFRYYEQPQAG